MSQNPSLKGNAPNRASVRKVLRSALANKGVADELLAAILGMTAQFDALLAKLDADTGVADRDYVATLGAGSAGDESFDPDADR